MRDFPRFVVSLGMKTTWFPIVIILLITAAMARTSPPQRAPRIVVSSESPALRLQNVRVDPHDGKVRGTAYLNFGYPSPRLPHVHVYGLDGSGKIVYEGCDKLSRDLLAPSPWLHKGRDSFSASLPANLNQITTIKVVASGGDDNCKMDDNRLFKLFSL
ncbi:MAG TPA: hypothetical protein VIS99_11385 [Terrimicrobiaceae bacterium]